MGLFNLDEMLLCSGLFWPLANSSLSGLSSTFHQVKDLKTGQSENETQFLRAPYLTSGLYGRYCAIPTFSVGHNNLTHKSFSSKSFLFRALIANDNLISKSSLLFLIFIFIYFFLILSLSVLSVGLTSRSKALIKF